MNITLGSQNQKNAIKVTFDKDSIENAASLANYLKNKIDSDYKIDCDNIDSIIINNVDDINRDNQLVNDIIDWAKENTKYRNQSIIIAKNKEIANITINVK